MDQDQKLKEGMQGLQLELAAFIADGKGKLPTRAWIETPYASVYIRAYTLSTGTWFDIGQIQVPPEHQRKGVCTLVFGYVEEFCKAAGYEAVRVENVSNDMLAGWLVRRGYVRMPDAITPCFFRKMADIHLTS